MAAVDFCLGMTGAAVFDSDYAINTIIPFTKRHNWFVPTYLALMCLAPLLNKALNAAGKKELVGWMAVLTLLNLYAYFFTVGSINPNGYTLFQFIYLYVFLCHYVILKWLNSCDSLPTIIALYVLVFIAAYILNELITFTYSVLHRVVMRITGADKG